MRDGSIVTRVTRRTHPLTPGIAISVYQLFGVVQILAETRAPENIRHSNRLKKERKEIHYAAPGCVQLTDNDCPTAEFRRPHAFRIKCNRKVSKV
jgi:hypothetical protein